ncbi:MAG: restriction endonuclease subunit S [Azoarcus sp.]|jgi:type I restriction enzyme S subunit|nr:restriction endonuclease subunit S [Azoarcus sp.]
MSGNEKRALVPRLRFPEFRAEWTFSPMSKAYSFKGNNSLSRDKLNYKGGSFRNIHYGDIHTKFALHFRVDSESVPYINDGESHSAIRPENYCSVGDMVFADASEDTADIGKAIEIIDTGDVPLVSGLHTILAKHNDAPFALGFGAYLFSSEGVRKQIQREAQGAKVLGLSASRLGNVLLHYPSETDEQQKIADCLSSLDELIAAETQKLDTLKTHKKGLMQQLFPVIDDNAPVGARHAVPLQPRLRFPEFWEAEGWKATPLSELAENLDNRRIPVTESNRTKGNVPYYGASGIVDYIQDFIFDDELLCISEDGANLVARATPIAFSISGKTWVNNHAHVLKFGRRYTQRLVENYLNFTSLEDFLTGMAQPKLNRAMLDTIPVPLPQDEDEQQKIADCLSSLDELIAAETQKLNTLKTHKKGLMQQLFPVMDGVLG